MTGYRPRILAACHFAGTVAVRAFDWCRWTWRVPPLCWLRAGGDWLCAPLYRREAYRAILRIEQDIAMIAPLGQPDLEAQLRRIQGDWVRRLSKLG